jgi:hypothetical protein
MLVGRMEKSQLAGIWVNSMNKSLSLNARSRRVRHIFHSNISEDIIPVLRILSWIRIRRIHMVLGLMDPDPLVRSTDPDPSIVKQN